MPSALLPAKKKKWPLLLGGALAALLVLYLVVTSGAFLKAFVLPQVGSALNSELTAEGVSLSPFSSLTLRQVKLTPKGAEPLAAIAEVRVRHSLFAILGGNLKVDEVTVDAPTITVVEHPDGTSNLSKLLDGLPKSEAKPKSSSSAAPKLDLRNVALKNGSLVLTRQDSATSSRTVATISGLNVTLDQLANGGSGKLTLAAEAGFAPAIPDQLHGKLNGSFDLAVDEQLLPKSLKGSLTADLATASGAFKEFAGLGATLDADATGTEVRQVRLSFRQRGAELGRIALSGPYDIAKKEARIAYEVAGLDRRVLGIAGAATGLGFADTTLSAAGRVDLAQRGTLAASNGKLTASRFSLVTTNGATPVLDLELDYKASINLTDQTALIEKTDLVLKQSARELVRGGFDRPMNIAWGKSQPGFREASYTLAITGLDLAAWRPVAGPSLPTGSLDAALKVTAENDGRLLKFTFTTGLRDLALTAAGAALANVAVEAGASGSIEDFTTFAVDKFNLGVKHGGAPLASFTGLARLHAKNQDLGAQLNGEVAVPAALGAFPVAGVSAAAGTLKLAGQYTARPGLTNASMDVALNGFNGRSGAMEFRDYQARVSATADIVQNTVTLQRANVTLQTGFEQGGTFDASGKYDLGRQTGRIEFKSVNVNQHGLAPFVAAAIAPNRLVSIALNLAGSATIDAAGGSTAQGDLKVTNFLVEDPDGRLPKTPLALGLGFDAGQRGTVTDLRKLLIALGPTPVASNELLLSGKFDLATNNAAPSSLSIKSDGLDLTTLYNLFAGDGKAKSAAPADTAKLTPVAGGAADVEPAPVKLPIQQFGLDLDIKRIHLREVALSNWVAKVTLNQGALALDPFNLVLNGAPLTAKAKADLNVPGYTYDVAFNAERIPLRPLVNSFQPERAGQIGGTAGAKVALKGAGITGVNLEKNLSGQLEFGATNLDLKLADVKSPLLKTIVNVVIGIPDLIRSPSLGTLASLTGLGGGNKAGGFLDEISQAPIGSLSATAIAGGGKINLQQALVQSPAFQADAKGIITLAAVLTNSALDLPVGVALKDSLGKKVGLTEAAGGYARMPDFLTIKGTVGMPKPDIAYAKLALLAGKAGLGLVGGTGGALGEKATGLLNAISGGASSNTNAAAKPGNVLGNALGNLLGGGAKTNAPGKTNTSPAAGLLDLFNKPKK